MAHQFASMTTEQKEQLLDEVLNEANKRKAAGDPEGAAAICDKMVGEVDEKGKIKNQNQLNNLLNPNPPIEPVRNVPSDPMQSYYQKAIEVINGTTASPEEKERAIKMAVLATYGIKTTLETVEQDLEKLKKTNRERYDDVIQKSGEWTEKHKSGQSLDVLFKGIQTFNQEVRMRTEEQAVNLNDILAKVKKGEPTEVKTLADVEHKLGNIYGSMRSSMEEMFKGMGFNQNPQTPEEKALNNEKIKEILNSGGENFIRLITQQEDGTYNKNLQEYLNTRNFAFTSGVDKSLLLADPLVKELFELNKTVDPNNLLLKSMFKGLWWTDDDANKFIQKLKEEYAKPDIEKEIANAKQALNNRPVEDYEYLRQCYRLFDRGFTCGLYNTIPDFVTDHKLFEFAKNNPPEVVIQRMRQLGKEDPRFDFEAWRQSLIAQDVDFDRLEKGLKNSQAQNVDLSTNNDFENSQLVLKPTEENKPSNSENSTALAKAEEDKFNTTKAVEFIENGTNNGNLASTAGKHANVEYWDPVKELEQEQKHQYGEQYETTASASTGHSGSL